MESEPQNREATIHSSWQQAFPRRKPPNSTSPKLVAEMTRLDTHFEADQLVYTTPLGLQVAAESRGALGRLPDESVDLVVTSPPFPLLRKKAYGNEDQAEYVDWLAEFAAAAHPKLKDSGSLVVDIGGAYRRGVPVRSLHQFRFVLKVVDELGYHLAEEFYWYNPSKLPSPIEWVNKRKIRAKDSVNTVWWFSKTEWPQADVNPVRVPYSDRMRKLLKDPEKFYTAADRPSQHQISKRFAKDNGGALPSNLLQIANTDSNSFYIRTARELGITSHPARFPEGLPEFFIRMLTQKGDLVVDIFSGSNTTGAVAERESRRWLAIEADREYAALSLLRFLEGTEDAEPAEAEKLYEKALIGSVDLRD